MALLISNAHWIKYFAEFRSRNRANGTVACESLRSADVFPVVASLPPKRSDDRKYVCASQVNGTEEAKKKKRMRKPGMQSTGGWDLPSPPQGNRNGANGTGGSQEKEAEGRNAKYRRLGHPCRATPPPPKKKSTACLTKIFFCPVGDERSFIVILLSDTWISTKLESFKDQVLGTGGLHYLIYSGFKLLWVDSRKMYLVEDLCLFLLNLKK